MKEILYSFIIIVFINALAFIWAYSKQTDKITDLTYNLSFIVVAWWAWYFYSAKDLGATLLALMITIWAGRLGLFLYFRVHQMGRDKRFDPFRAKFYGFLQFWVLQAISIWIISLPIIIYLSKGEETNVWIGGAGLWLTGLIIETVADHQKNRFKKSNPDKHYRKGVFSYIRYPNYLGEILCWTGIYLYVFPTLKNWEALAVISPLWILILLIGISGIPLLERKANKKYGNDPEYKEYIRRTHRLIPWIY